MANANRPSGLAPVSYLNGAKYSGACRAYSIASNDANAYGVGDPVASSGTADAAGVAGVTLATAGAGNAIRGIIVGTRGIKYGAGFVDPASLDTTIIPATKTKVYYVLVADDPNLIFEGQEDSIGNNLAITDVASNLDLVSGANSGYLSGWMLDSSTVNTGSTRQVKLLGLAQRSDNALGQYGKWLVLINNHELRVGSTGI
jgi:hypothetical protein